MSFFYGQWEEPHTRNLNQVMRRWTRNHKHGWQKELLMIWFILHTEICIVFMLCDRWWECKSKACGHQYMHLCVSKIFTHRGKLSMIPMNVFIRFVFSIHKIFLNIYLIVQIIRRKMVFGGNVSFATTKSVVWNYLYVTKIITNDKLLKNSKIFL